MLISTLPPITIFIITQAFTAGTGGTITSGEAADSICPRNWKLPTSNNQNDGSFYYLLAKYGLQSSVTSGNNNIATDPLFFVRSGLVLPNGSYLNYTSYSGRYWSSSPYPNGTYAYSLRFNNSGMYPSDHNNRYAGFSLRCLARELRGRKKLH